MFITNIVFYLSSTIAIASTIYAIYTKNIVHSLLTFGIFILMIAIIFNILSCEFVSIIEIIIYIGVIIVLLTYVFMTVNVKDKNIQVKSNNTKKILNKILKLSISLVSTLIIMIHSTNYFNEYISKNNICIKDIGISLFGTYILVTEISSILLLGGIISIFYIYSNNIED